MSVVEKAQQLKRLKALQRQVEKLSSRIETLVEKNNALSRYRLLTFFGTLIWTSAGLLLKDDLISILVFAMGAMVFIALAYADFMTKASLKRHRIWLKHKQHQVARIKIDWKNLPEHTEGAADTEHPFANDLDIVGPHSLFRLIDTTTSKDGGHRLKGWLTTTAPIIKNVRARQSLIKELVPLTRFRNRLALSFALVSSEKLDGKGLLRWLEKQQLKKTLKPIVWLLSIIAFFSWLSYLLYLFNDIPGYWGAGAAAYFIIYLFNSRTASRALTDSVFMDDELKKLKALFTFLESYKYQKKSTLAEFCRPFWQDENRPSKEIKKIKVVATLAGLAGNPVLGLILNIVCPWNFYCAALMVKYKKELMGLLPVWMNQFSKLEACLSLANFRYINPHFAFPEFKENANRQDMVFSGVDLGHPLIPQKDSVPNSFSCSQQGDIAVITGSNMAGKSTFLKSLGINLVLAYAGGPVCATGMQTSLFRLYTSIKINDSVTDGFSFFYAEVRRLKRLLDGIRDRKQAPLFFLIDEIFRGTNNKERLIGSRSIIRALADETGIGAISTHDLELIKLADDFENIRNFHFREDVVEGKMVFDYVLRKGPCPTTNALTIMAMEGLPVDV